MSFSLDVKNEVLGIIKDEKCNIAELSSIINYCGKIKRINLKKIFTIQADNEIPLKKAKELLLNIFSIDIEIIKKRGKAYKIVIEDENIINNILYKIKIDIQDETVCSLGIIKNICSKRAYIRGAFICSGYISNPKKSYHIEFINSSLKQAENLKNTINYFEIQSKIIEKKGSFMVYIKESEQIVQLLNIIEAHKALIDLENIRILKDVRNNVNRIVNCETANLNKVVSTGIIQKQNIEYIQNKIGIENLPPQLIEIAKIRLENPDVSLQELSEMVSIKISKSGINHRLKRINNIAKELRGM